MYQVEREIYECTGGKRNRVWMYKGERGVVYEHLEVKE